VDEAFAIVPMLYADILGVDYAKMNPNGGAIAMGHPLGATGAVIMSVLIDELERQDKQTGLATLCVGGGMAVSTIIERV
jgi:acetyl-CoA C-acetyltransferase